MLDLLNRLLAILETVMERADAVEFLRALTLVLLASALLVESLR